MTIGINVRGITTELGPGGLLHAFCSSVAQNLEHGKWGSRFPALQTKLYEGRASASDASQIESELREIRELFSSLGPDKVVWDIDNPRARPEWGTDIAPHVTNLSMYFVTNAQRNLFDVLIEVVELARELDCDMEIVSYR